MTSKSRDVILTELVFEFLNQSGWTPQEWETFHSFIVKHERTPKMRGYAKLPDGSLRRDVDGKAIVVVSPIWGDQKVLRQACSRLFAEPGLPRMKDGIRTISKGGIMAREAKYAKLSAKYRQLVGEPIGSTRGKTASPPPSIDLSVIPD